MPAKKDPKLARIGAKSYNKPVRTPNHKTKSHAVVARKSDGSTKLVRFGQQGVRGAGKNPKTAKEKARKKSFLARHNAQNPNPDKFSALHWAKKTKWG
jgi:hypothetical protein|tara:strand:+ start:1301 stop:1594 length:294 start_codon:yes stop_codon:yes gene_type:complete